MSWRITFVDGSKISNTVIQGVDYDTKLVKPEITIKHPNRLELRDKEGQIVRLGENAEFTLKDLPMGLVPEYYGEFAILDKGAGGKYRTSCYNGVFGPTQRPDIFWKPSLKPNVDEVYAIKGDLVIWEFDEDLKPFNICVVCEGEKGVIEYDTSAKSIRERYKANISRYSGLEYSYVLDNYLDSRKWR